MFVWLAESVDFPNLVRRQEKILHCLWGWPSVRMRDSQNRIQGNDLGAGWIDHHTDLLLLFALLYGMVNLSDLPIVEWRRFKPCLNLGIGIVPCTRQLLPTVGYTVRFNPDPFSAGETINRWPPWDIDSCLVLAPDPSAKKTQSRNNLTKIKGRKNWGKGYATTGRAREGIFRGFEKTDTVNNMDGVYEFSMEL